MTMNNQEGKTSPRQLFFSAIKQAYDLATLCTRREKDQERILNALEEAAIFYDAYQTAYPADRFSAANFYEYLTNESIGRKP